MFCECKQTSSGANPVAHHISAYYCCVLQKAQRVKNELQYCWSFQKSSVKISKTKLKLFSKNNFIVRLIQIEQYTTFVIICWFTQLTIGLLGVWRLKMKCIKDFTIIIANSTIRYTSASYKKFYLQLHNGVANLFTFSLYWSSYLTYPAFTIACQLIQLILLDQDRK